MTKAQKQARQQWNRELAREDRLNRCAYCQRNLLEPGMRTVIVIGEQSLKLCADCAQQERA
jgi:hypothetical protein